MSSNEWQREWLRRAADEHALQQEQTPEPSRISEAIAIDVQEFLGSVAVGEVAPARENMARASTKVKGPAKSFGATVLKGLEVVGKALQNGNPGVVPRMRYK